MGNQPTPSEVLVMRRLAALVALSSVCLACAQSSPPSSREINDLRLALPSFPSFPPAEPSHCDVAALTGIEAARRMLAVGLSHKPRLRSANGTTVTMSAVPAMAVTDFSGEWVVKGPVPSQTFDLSDLDSGGSWAPSTYYFMYLYLSGKTIRRVVTTALPDEFNRYRAGLTAPGMEHLYAYVGSFYVDNVGRIVSFVASNGVYHRDLSIRTPFNGKSGEIDLLSTGLLPTSAREAILSVRGTFSTVDAPVILYFAAGDGVGLVEWQLQTRVTDSGGIAKGQPDTGANFHVDTDDRYRIKYMASDDGYDYDGGGTGWLYGVGYVEH